MILENFWMAKLKSANIPICKQLQKDITCDVVVIGGGVAGLHAAQTLLESKLKVVLIEKSICGASSSGKSSGFLTPESELGLYEVVKKYGQKDAKELWEIAKKGVDLIVNNVQKNNIKCDLEIQDSLYLGIGKSGEETVQNQAKIYKKLGYPYKLHSKKELVKIHPTNAYVNAISYPQTHSITSLLYVQELKRILIKNGLEVYENTEALEINNNLIKTCIGSIKAKNIIVCIDKMKKEFSEASKNTYHGQTFLSISKPLTKQQIKDLFPDKKFMCWDTNLIYSYYRLTKDKRLLLGGGSAVTTFSPSQINSPIIIKRVIKKFKSKFPRLKDLQFKNYWPGLIDITQDLMPIVDYDKDNKLIQYVQGCPGLPWAAFCGWLAAQNVMKKQQKDYKYFKASRKFLIPISIQNIITKPVTYAISSLYSEYH